MARKYSIIRAEGDATKPAEMLLYDVIGADPWTGGGITAERVLADLKALGQDSAIDVRINSPGGEVYEGVAIYNALARHPGKVTVHIDGFAASIATLIAMAGDEIRVAENAVWMVHQPWTFAMGNAPEMRRIADSLDKHWAAMLTTYERRTGRAAAELAQRVTDAGGEWWMTAAEAVAEGFADTVVDPSEDAVAYGLGRFGKVPERIAASLRTDADEARNSVLANLAQSLGRAAAVELSPPRKTVAQAPTDTPAEDPDQARRRRVVEVLRLS